MFVCVCVCNTVIIFLFGYDMHAVIISTGRSFSSLNTLFEQCEHHVNRPSARTYAYVYEHQSIHLNKWNHRIRVSIEFNILMSIFIELTHTTNISHIDYLLWISKHILLDIFTNIFYYSILNLFKYVFCSANHITYVFHEIAATQEFMCSNFIYFIQSLCQRTNLE